MDQRLVTWACRRKRRNGPPPLWLFSDAARMPDLLRVVRNLPKGLCGVVFRHDMAADRAALGGIDGGSIKVLGKNCAGAGAIDAFLSRE